MHRGGRAELLLARGLPLAKPLGGDVIGDKRQRLLVSKPDEPRLTVHPPGAVWVWFGPGLSGAIRKRTWVAKYETTMKPQARNQLGRYPPVLALHSEMTI